MSRFVRIATVQPPAVRPSASRDIVDSALGLLAEAAQVSDIVCLPEYLNCTHLIASDTDGSPEEDRTLLKTVRRIAAAHRCYVVLPMIVEAGGSRTNRALLIDRGGQIMGYHDKVHLTRNERDVLGLTAGRRWDVFDCDFGRVGIMICYDGCFVESARILGLKGAELIFWPTLQRSYVEAELDLQVRAHAVFNQLVVVRSSYGWPMTHAWAPGNMVGMSCICHPDGTYLASLGKRTGWTGAIVDLDAVPLGFCSHGGKMGCIRQMRLADRAPHTYHTLSRTRPSDSNVPIHVNVDAPVMIDMNKNFSVE